METYETMRQIADSWVLLAMTVFFVGVVLWAFFRPNAKAEADAAANIPFAEAPVPNRSGVAKENRNVDA